MEIMIALEGPDLAIMLVFATSAVAMDIARLVLALARNTVLLSRRLQVLDGMVHLFLGKTIPI